MPRATSGRNPEADRSVPMTTSNLLEIARVEGRPRHIKHAVFDFDGTLSWLRHGWPGMMLEVLAAHLPPATPAEQKTERAELLRLFMALNGKPTIFQIEAFRRYAAGRGLSVPESEPLRRAYQELLDTHIAQRSERVRRAEAPPDAYVVTGARSLLEHLCAKGVRLSILSSTVEHRVREEAEILGLAHFFEGRIHGSPADPSGFAKRTVFEQILQAEKISGDSLLAFGDGPVEIADARQLGGIAVAVCSDEHINGSGECDPLKKEQLLEAGAHLAIPDFQHAAEWLAPLFAS